MAHAAAVQVGGANGRPLVVYHRHFGMHVDRAVARRAASVAGCGSRQRKEAQAPCALGAWRAPAQPGDRVVGIAATGIRVVGQQKGKRDPTLGGVCHLTQQRLHRRALPADPPHVQPLIALQPEILILEVDEAARLANGQNVRLHQAMDTPRRKRIGERGNRADDLHARHRCGECRVSAERGLPLLRCVPCTAAALRLAGEPHARKIGIGREDALQEIRIRAVPALLEIARHVFAGRPTKHHVDIVPAMPNGRRVDAAQRRIQRVRGNIPAVVVAVGLDREVHPTNKREVVIHHGALLMQRLRNVQGRAAARIQPAGNAPLDELALLQRGIVDHVHHAAWVERTPEQDTHIHAAARGEGQHIHHPQRTRLPERDG